MSVDSNQVPGLRWAIFLTGATVVLCALSIWTRIESGRDLDRRVDKALAMLAVDMDRAPRCIQIFVDERGIEGWGACIGGEQQDRDELYRAHFAADRLLDGIVYQENDGRRQVDLPIPLEMRAGDDLIVVKYKRRFRCDGFHAAMTYGDERCVCDGFAHDVAAGRVDPAGWSCVWKPAWSQALPR